MYKFTSKGIWTRIIINNYYYYYYNINLITNKMEILINVAHWKFSRSLVVGYDETYHLLSYLFHFNIIIVIC